MYKFVFLLIPSFIDKKYLMGFSSSAVKEIISHVEILSKDDWPDADMLGLDPSQAKALFAALTRKLVLIQGPPGVIDK